MIPRQRVPQMPMTTASFFKGGLIASPTARRVDEAVSRRYRRMATLGIGALLLLGYAALGLSAPSANRPIWTGTSGDFHIVWTASDLRVSRRENPSETRLSLRALAKTAWTKMAAEAAEQRLDREVTYRLLSAVGPYLSYEEEDYCDCGGAHPSAVKQFHAIDLENTRADSPAPVALTDLFTDRDVFTALVSDPLVQSVLRGAETPPTALADLLEALEDRAVLVGDCEYLFSRDLLRNFAFYDLRAGQVAIRISLPHATEVCRGQMAQLGLLLPIPGPLKGALEAARRRTDGVLMGDTAALFKNAQTIVMFSTAKP